MNYKELENEIKEIKESMKGIESRIDNHIVHISADIAQMKNDLVWIKKFFWMIATISMTAIVGSVFNLIIK